MRGEKEKERKSKRTGERGERLQEGGIQEGKEIGKRIRNLATGRKGPRLGLSRRGLA